MTVDERIGREIPIMDEHGPDAPEHLKTVEYVHAEPTSDPDQSHPHPGPHRLYLPTLPELIDRLAITQLKAIFIPEHAEAYREEMALIMHDVDMILREQPKLDAEAIRAVLILMLANRFIWENESKARAGGPEQDKLLKCTHSINGVRNTAKNVIAAKTGGRKDFKTDSLAADLPPEFGHWDVFR